MPFKFTPKRWKNKNIPQSAFQRNMGRRRPSGMVTSNNNMRPARWIKPVELKYKDITAGTAAMAVAGSTTAVSLIAPFAQSNTAITRIGAKAFIKNLMVKGTVDIDTQAVPTALRIRILIWIDHQSNGLVPTLAELLSIGGSQDPLVAFRLLQNSRRFSVLYDKKINLQNPAGAGNTSTNTFGQVKREFSLYKTFKTPLTVRFKDIDTSGLDAAILDNNVWIAVFGDGTIGNYQWESRMRFTD